MSSVESPPDAGEVPQTGADAAPETSSAAETETTSTGSERVEESSSEQTFLGGKFKSVDDLERSYKELQAAISRRDEDAAVGKQFRQHEPEFQEFLRSKQTAEAERAAKEEASKPSIPTMEEVQILEARVLDEQGNFRANARAEDKAKLTSAYDLMKRRAMEFALKGKDAIADTVRSILQEERTKWEQEAAQRQAYQADAQAVEAFVDQNAEWLFRDAKNPQAGRSPEGDRFVEHVEAKRNYYAQRGIGLPESELVQIAMAEFRVAQNSNGDGRPDVKPGGKRKAEKSHQSETLEEQVEKMIERGEPMTVVDRFVMEQGGWPKR